MERRNDLMMGIKSDNSSLRYEKLKDNIWVYRGVVVFSMFVMIILHAAKAS